MKTLTANQAAAVAATGGHSIARILLLGDTYYTVRDPDNVFNPDASKTFQPLIREWKPPERSADKGINTLPKIQRFRFSIWISDKYGTPIDQQVNDTVGNFAALPVTAFEVLRPLTGSVTEADWVTIFSGEIEEVTEMAVDHVSFKAVDFMKYPGGKKQLRTITLDVFPTCPPKNLGGGMPLIFGQISDVPGIQVSSGASSALGASLDAGELDEMTVDDTSVFTTTGSVQIGSERIEYGGKTASLLTGLLRAQDGTTDSDHAIGSLVTQLDTIRFLIADHAITNDLDIAGTVKDADGSVFATDQYEEVNEETPAGSGVFSTFVDVLQTGFPPIIETLSSTVKKDLAEDLDDADNLVQSDWEPGGLNAFVINALNVVDSDEATQHVTNAVVKEGETLHVKFKAATDLSGQTGTIKKASAFIEYGILPSRDESWPSTPPTFDVTEDASVEISKDLGEPTELSGDAKIHPESDSGATTEDLYKPSNISSGFRTTVSTRFKRIQTPHTQVWTTNPDIGDIENDSFLLLQGFSDGAIINYDLTNVRSTAVSGATSSPVVIGDAVAAIRALILRIYDDGNWPTKTAQVDIELTVRGFNTSVKGSASVEIFIGTHSFLSDRGTVTDLDFNTIKTVRARLTASEVGVDFFTTTDLASIEIRAEGNNQTIVPFTGAGIQTAADRILYRILAVDASIVEQTIFSGETDPIDSTSIVPSQRLRQSTLITSLVEAGGGWAWFGPSFLPGISIDFPAQSNAYQIVVYNVGFEVEVTDSSTRATLPSEFTLRADVTGIVSTTATTISAEAVISILLVVPGAFYGLSGDNVDGVSLAAALDIIALNLASEDKDDWIFQRRITENLTNRELLREVLTDTGIRAVIDGGRLLFFPRISIDPNTEFSVRDIDSDKMKSTVRSTTSITLVTNSLRLQYAQSLITTGLFNSEVTETDAESVAAVNARETILQSKWIRDDDVAEALAQHLVDDFKLPRSLINTSIQGGRAYDLEVGDYVTFTDAFVNLVNIVCRITDISFANAMGSEVNFVMALSNRATIIWAHGDPGDADYSKIEVNNLTQSMTFTVDEVIVARLNGTALSIKGDFVDALATVSTENAVAQAAPALDRSNNTGLVEYSPGEIIFGVYDGATEKYYAVAALGATELFFNAYEDDPGRPLILPGFDWTANGQYIETTNTIPSENGSVVMSVDLSRLYMSFEYFLNGAAINGRLAVNNITTNVNF